MLAAPAEVPGVPIVGDIFAGKYTVEQVLGHGGMGVVVSARHLALGQLVAVKFLLPSVASQPAAVGRFLREARSAVTIQSDHVARVLDIGTLENGVPYMVMEHLVGTDLRRVIAARGQLEVGEAVEYVLQACEAIAEAHALGIIDRDLKPANLFVTTSPDGSPFLKVLDFGLSTASAAHMYGAEETSLTTAEAVMGSPPYMSPEQIRSLKSVDARTDIWSLGVILYRLLAGRRPFVGETLTAICASIAADMPVPLTTIRADVPPELDAIVRRCLAKDVSERVQTVAELASGLAPFGSPEALVSLNRIIKATPGAVTPATSSISTSGQMSPISASGQRSPISTTHTSRRLEAHDPSTANGNAWAQPPGASKRGSKFSIAILGVVVGAAIGVAIVSTQQTAVPRFTAPGEQGVAAAPPPSGVEATSGSDAPTASATTLPLVSSVSAASSVSVSPSNTPKAPNNASATRGSVRPKPPPTAKVVDPLERWK